MPKNCLPVLQYGQLQRYKPLQERTDFTYNATEHYKPLQEHTDLSIQRYKPLQRYKTQFTRQTITLPNLFNHMKSVFKFTIFLQDCIVY